MRTAGSLLWQRFNPLLKRFKEYAFTKSEKLFIGVEITTE